MLNDVDKLKTLLAAKIAELRSRQEQLTKLQTSTDALKGQIEGVQEAIKAISPEGDHPTSANREQQNGDADGKLTPTILQLIEAEGTSPGLLPSEIVAKLMSRGSSRSRTELYSSVYPVCQRLVKQGKVKEGVKNGKRSFMKNQPI